MIKNEYLAKVYKTELTRDPDTLKYTLGDKQLDDLFDLGQMSSGFGPSKESVVNFAAATYLYGIIGYKATNYTSVPGGFLVTYQKENEGKNDVATILVGDNKGIYWINEISYLYNKQMHENAGNYTKAELDFIERTYYKMQFEEKYKLHLAESGLLRDCAIYADIINSADADMPNIKYNILQAMFPFSFSKEPMSLNTKNCEENHTLLDMFCAKELGLNYDALVDEVITFNQQGAKDHLKQIEDMRNDILNGWILPGYFTFVGNKRGIPTARNAEILNHPAWFAQLEEKVHNPRALAAIVNMCATDYTADVVYGMLDVLNNSKSAINDVSTSIEDLENIMPETKLNSQKVANIRQAFWRKYYAKEQGFINE